MYKKILIANNGSEGAFKALVEALRLAHSHGSETHMIYVEEDIPWNKAKVLAPGAATVNCPIVSVESL
jgi:nucleotide-binding universal stress UspA family protein